MDQKTADIVWMLVTGSLVFLMQAGFMCLETGFTRSKNSINVAIKNFIDFCLAICLYWAAGYALMFGATHNGWYGTSPLFFPFESQDSWHSAFFFFQLMFCATAATIVSGAVAERLHFSAYLFITLVISGVIYPLYGHWAWNGADGVGSGGWLKNMGFVDFAGSSVVHSVGGWVSLAALLVVGARNGRFPKDGEPQKITGHNVPMSVLGAMLLYMGWFGFNGGSTLAINDQIGRIIANTTLAGATGAIATLFVGWLFLSKRPDVEYPINGSLAGLVAITANCHAVTASDAAIIGAIGGVVMLAVDVLLIRLKVDDAVGAVPVHLGGGIWGTMAVAIFGRPEDLATGKTYWEQMGVQALGVVVAALLAGLLVYIVLKLWNTMFPLRVNADDEHRGLNYTEHGATTELIDLMTAMERQGRAGDLGMRVPVEPFTEVGQIAVHYNKVMDMLQVAVARAEGIVRDIQDGIITFAHDGVLTSANPGAEKLFGYRFDELMGRPVHLLFATAGGASYVPLELSHLVNAGAKSNGATVYGVRNDKSVFPVDIRIVAGERQGVRGYTGLVKDVTERKRAEEALQASRDRMRHHTESLSYMAMVQRRDEGELRMLLGEIARVASDTLRLTSMVVWKYDSGNKVLVRDYVCLTRAGEVGSEEIPTLAFDALPEFYAGKAGQRVLAAGDALHDSRLGGLLESYLAPRDIRALILCQMSYGKELWGILCLEDQSGRREWHPEEYQFAGSVADFLVLAYEDQDRRIAEETVRGMNEALEARVEERTTELRSSNDQLRQTLDRLERTQTQLVTAEKMAALGELVAGVAHEINTPVGIAVTAASHLEEKTRKTLETYDGGALKRTDLESYLRLANESSRMLMSNLTRAADLVQSFKNVAVDQSSEARRMFNLRDYIEEILLSLRPKLKKTKHKVEVDCPDGIELNSYPGAYSRIITNFIVNSTIHGFEEDEAGTMRLKAHMEREYLFLTYSDNGKGITQENLGRIFDPFFTTRRGKGGSGLGLHIVYNIVSGQLEGSISCESTPGVGTAFTLQLPLTLRGDE